MSSSSIKHVLVVGASGHVGSSTVKALLDEGVRHLKSDYSKESLREAFKGHDAVISTISSIIPGGDLNIQKTLVDAAISAGVKVFFPSEYGIDTSSRTAPDYIPFLVDKIGTVDYLKSSEDQISWTALISGSMFDWGLDIPGFGGLNVPARTATIFSGGDIPYEATNLDQVGRAIAKCLKNPGLTRNQYVYVNSFTVAQNEVLKALEGATNEKFAVSEDTVDHLWQSGADSVNGGDLMGTLAMIAGAIYGKSGLAQFSKNKGLWNERLGLPQEDLNEFVNKYIAGKR